MARASLPAKSHCLRTTDRLCARASTCYARPVIELLPVLIVQHPVLLPESTAFIVITGPADAALARAARRSKEPFTFAAFLRHVPDDEPTEPARTIRLMPIGCAAVVEQVVVEGGQILGIRARGLARVELIADIEPAAGALLQAEVAVLDARAETDDLLRAQLARVRTRVHTLHPPLDAEARAALTEIDDPGHFADALAALLDDLTLAQRLQLLTTPEPAARLVLVERLLDARTSAPTRQFSRVWFALRSPSTDVPTQTSLRAQARGIDASSLQDPRLRGVVEAMVQAEPGPAVSSADSRELQFRRENLAQLTAAIRSLTALRECASPDDPDDVAVQAEISATIAFLFVVAGREHTAITGTPASGIDLRPARPGADES